MKTTTDFQFIKLLAEERGVTPESMLGQAIGLIELKLSAPGADKKVVAQWATLTVRQKADIAVRLINRYNHQ
jgi:hypothetical protein